MTRTQINGFARQSPHPEEGRHRKAPNRYLNHIVRDAGVDGFCEVPYGDSFIGSDNVLHPWQVASMSSGAALAEIGVYRVAPVTVPEGKTLVSYKFVKDGGTVAAVGTFTDISAQPLLRRLLTWLPPAFRPRRGRGWGPLNRSNKLKMVGRRENYGHQTIRRDQRS
jgi:hypothetical protein